MPAQTFDEIAIDLRKAIVSAGIPAPYDRYILDLYRGPFSNSDALATMWEYYDMTPGAPAVWTFDDVSRKMRQSANDWAAAHKAAGEFERLFKDPRYAPLVAELGRTADWGKLVAEVDRRIESKDDIRARTVAIVEKAAQAARQEGLSAPLAETIRLAHAAAEKNAEAFRMIDARDPGKGRAPASVAYGYGAHSAFWGGVAGCGAMVVKAAGGAGVIAAGGLGVAIAGTGLCVYGLYRAKRAYWDDDY